MDSFFDDYEKPKALSIWRANHGNWLLGLVALIGVVGSLILMFGSDSGALPGGGSQVAGENEAEFSIDQDDSPDDEPTVTVFVRGILSDQGQVMLAVYDAANQFNDPTHAVLKAPREIEDGTAKWVIAVKKLPNTFALAAFHDENADLILNRNALGIPIESYGFSNQARANFGPPTFEQAVLSRPEQGEEMEIQLGTAVPVLQ